MKKIFIFFLFFYKNIAEVEFDTFYYNVFCKSTIDDYVAKQNYELQSFEYLKDKLKDVFRKIDTLKISNTCDNVVVNRLLHYTQFEQKHYILDNIDTKKISKNLCTNINFRKGIENILQRKYTEAIDIFCKIKEGTDKKKLSSLCDYYIAYCYFCIGEGDKTIEILTPLYVDTEGFFTQEINVAIIVLLIISLYKKNEIKKILSLEDVCKNKCKKDDERNKIIYSILGDIYLQEKQFVKAILYYEKALKISSKDINLFNIKIAFCLYKIGKRIEAENILIAIENNKKEDIEYIVYFYLGVILLERGEYEKALIYFKNISNTHPTSDLTAEALFCQGICQMYLKKTNEALTLFESFTEKYKQHSLVNEVNRLIIDISNPNYDFSNMLEYIESSENISISYDEKKIYQIVNVKKALEAYQHNDFNKSLSFCINSLKFNVDIEISRMAHFLCGEIYSYSKEYTKAIYHYEQVLSTGLLFLKNKALYGLGYCYFFEKKYAKALDVFQIIDPSFMTEDVSIRIADCFYNLDNYEAAVYKYKDIISNDAKNVHCLYYCGLANLYLQNINSAEYYFNLIINFDHSSIFYKKAIGKRIECLKTEYSKKLKPAANALLNDKRSDKKITTGK